MGTEVTQVTADELKENQTDVEAAYEALGEALKKLSITNERYPEVQKQHFDLKAAMLACDDDFQEINLDGTRLNIPSSHSVVGGNPTAQDDLGEVELPTRDGHFRVLDGIQVADPDNPHNTHAVTIDHVIETDGEVRVEVNANTLDELSGGN